tara:strand:- start:230 stop:517 length:288 start_codon:yes stop_codon:yes gene_type:complete
MKVRKILRLLKVIERLPRDYDEDVQKVNLGTYYSESQDEHLEIMDMDFIYVLNAIKKHGINNSSCIEEIHKLTLELTNEKAKNIKLKQIKEIVND